MAFSRMSITELRDYYEAKMASKFGILTPLLPKSIVRVLAYMFAGGDHLLYGFLQYFAVNAIIDTANTEYLGRWATIWGLSRKAATYASGIVTFSGVDTTVVPAGTTIKRADDQEFSTDAAGTISGGSVDISVTATLAGSDGNTAAASTLTLSSPIAGVDSSVVVGSDGIADGADQETDELLRARLLNRIQQPPQGGNQNDFVQWALSVAGVTRAWCLPNYLGLGTVGVTFVEDDNEISIIPSSAKVQEVEDYIDVRRPVTAAVTVFAPTAVALDVEVDISPNTAAVQAEIEAELEDLLLQDAEPGVTILISRIRQAISNAQGESDHDLISPTADVTYAASELPVLGTITFGALT